MKKSSIHQQEYSNRLA